MATSTNYLWTEPNDSDLVKNGASAIRTLGDAIDASLWSSGFGQAGKNKIINGDFGINQRAFTSFTGEAMGYDRMLTVVTAGGGTVTTSAQTFTAGTAPVTGYEATNFYRCVTSGQTGTDSRAGLAQRIENVRNFANQTMTVSFWAKAASGTPNITVSAQQRFGTGGSTAVWTLGTVKTISTSWARYSFTITLPSIAGKTIVNADSSLNIVIFMSAGSDLSSTTAPIGVQNNTFDIWGWQVESGSTATPFQTASGGSPQAELAMCQRYYWRNQATGTASQFYIGAGTTATTAQMTITLPVKMRANANPLEYSTLALADNINPSIAVTSLTIAANSDQTPSVIATVASGLTANRPYYLVANASTNAYIAFSAEL